MHLSAMILSHITTWLVLVLATCYLIWRWTRRHFENLAEKIPGPRPLPFIGNILDMGFNTVDLYKNTHKLCAAYSPLCRVWIGPKLYIGVQDPRDLEIILGNPKYNDKAYMYNFLHPWLGTGLLTSKGEKWHKHRKIITPTFHFKILEEFLHSFNNKANILIKRLQKEVNGPTFDIYKYMTLYTLDTITETAMGLNLNAQTNETSQYVSAVKKMGDIIIKRSLGIWYYPNAIFNRSPLGKAQKQALSILHGTTNKMIQEKKKDFNENNVQNPLKDADFEMGIKKRVAFLDLLLQKNAKGESISDEHVREEVDTFMFEGHDTTSSSLSFTLWLLSTHQDIQDKVYNEIQAVLGDTETPTTQIMNEMKYLECVIKESLRLYPSVPLLGREIFEDVKITGNITLPANSTIMIILSIVHKNPKIYPNPEAFDPDRFSPDSARELHPYAFIPFSAGSRNCIGQKFAMLEMKIAIAKVLMNYKLLPDETFKPILSAELILKSMNGIRLKIIPRHSQETL